ncbi:hypothetical protein CGZ95_12420 [Enemella evansiae]|uniref:hypothetical protein n=1 Tax=Enemella evansiae TaxID=2016499 RepID=UPI000B96D2E8|nr:hypothetical protein [Enemella evansiae]OYN98556.1 hypothetical protein CGZ95_12420 [Enemella evansiae]
MLIDSNHRSDDLSALVKARVRRIGSLMAVAALVAAMVVTLYTAFSMIRSTNGAATTADLPGWIWTNGRIPISEPAAEKLMQFLATVMLGLFFATALKERDSRDPEQLARLAILDFASYSASVITCVSSLVIAISVPRGMVTILAVGLAIISSLLAALTASNPTDRARWLSSSVAREHRMAEVAAAYYPDHSTDPDSLVAMNRIDRLRIYPLFSSAAIFLLVGALVSLSYHLLQVPTFRGVTAALSIATLMSIGFILVGDMCAQSLVLSRERRRRRPRLPVILMSVIFAIYMIPVVLGLRIAAWTFSAALFVVVVRYAAPTRSRDHVWVHQLEHPRPSALAGPHAQASC